MNAKQLAAKNMRIAIAGLITSIALSSCASTPAPENQKTANVSTGESDILGIEMPDPDRILTYTEAVASKSKNNWKKDPVRPSPKYMEYRKTYIDNYFKQLEQRPAIAKSFDKGWIVTASGLKYNELKTGTGLYPKAGGHTLIHYTAWLEDGSKVDSSTEKGIPFHFVYGRDKTMFLWEEGLKGMRVGGMRTIVMPPALTRANDARTSKVPASSTVIYKVSLLSTGKG